MPFLLIHRMSRPFISYIDSLLPGPCGTFENHLMTWMANCVNISEYTWTYICYFTVEVGCPAGFVNQDLEEDTTKFMMACVQTGSNLTPILKRINGNRSFYHAIDDGTSCEIGAQSGECMGLF